MEKITGIIDGYIWSIPLIILALCVGLYFSIRMGFPQIRKFKDMVCCSVSFRCMSLPWRSSAVSLTRCLRLLVAYMAIFCEQPVMFPSRMPFRKQNESSPAEKLRSSMKKMNLRGLS